MQWFTRPSEKERLLSDLAHITSELCLREYRGRKPPLGIEVATSTQRNFYLASMTFDAVRHLKEQGKERVSVLELGLGSGVNGVAALLAGADMVYGLEVDPLCTYMAHQLCSTYGLQDHLSYEIGNFFTQDPKNYQGCDVLINENLCRLPLQEPQVPASQYFLPAQAEHTLFVPSGVSYRLEMRRECHDIGTLRFDSSYPGPAHSLESIIPSTRRRRVQATIQGKILDAFGEGLDIDDMVQLPLSRGFQLPMEPGNNRLTMTFGTSPDTYREHNGVYWNNSPLC